MTGPGPGGAGGRVFGPVPSWRLGRSLGVDLAPFKRCNWNCVYCQLGRTRPLAQEPLASPVPGEILGEARRVLERTAQDAVDWITLLGSGEPLLCAGIGEVVRGLKGDRGLPVALLTNGSLLAFPEIRGRILEVDAILPSLSAPTPELHLALHRPHRRFPFGSHLQGLQELRREFGGLLWVEVMLVEGANDGEEEVEGVARQLTKIAPDEIHLNRPTRPPAEPWVRAPASQVMSMAREILERVAPVRVPGEEGSARGAAAGPPTPLPLGEGLPLLLAGIVERHPMTREELGRFLGEGEEGELDRTLEAMVAEGALQKVERLEKVFWASGKAFFPGKSVSHPPPWLRGAGGGGRS